VLGGVAVDLADARAQQRWLQAFGANPEAHPYAFFATKVYKGMSRPEVERAMPRPTRIERFVVRTADGESALLERYVYHLVIRDWPVDVYYNGQGRVMDFYAGDNPGLGVSPGRLTPGEAELWSRPQTRGAQGGAPAA